MAKTAIFLAEGFEEIEALTVVDLLRRAGIEIATVSITGKKQVTGSHNVPVIADTTIEELDFEDQDMLILPGGAGYPLLEKCDALKEKVLAFDKEEKSISAICGAPTVLAHWGILEGKKACSFPGVQDDLAGAVVLQDEVVVDGHITTSRGMGTSIPFGLAIVERFQGKEAADKLAKRIVYRQ